MTYNGTHLGGTRLRTAMAKHVNKYFGSVIPVTAENILFANGVSAICSMLGFILGDPNDGVLLMRPVYGKFRNDWGIMAGYVLSFEDLDKILSFGGLYILQSSAEITLFIG